MTAFHCTTAVFSFSKEALKNIKPEEWTNRALQLLKSMQDILTLLYEGVEPDETSTISDADREKISSLRDELTLPQMAQIFSQCCQNLTVLLSESSNGPVRFPVVNTMTVISRCLSVSYTNVKAIPSLAVLAKLLPDVQQSALDVLSQLIVSCRTNLLPQTRTIVDLCLQTLASSTHMENTDRSQSRACVYQVLCLLIQILGWGRYLSQHSKLMTQELCSDISWQDKDSSQIVTAGSAQSKQDGQRKGKKKKRNKGESYGDLNIATAGMNGVDNKPCNIEATLGSLEVSRLIIEREEFSRVENLVRCILETTRTLQREGPPVVSPFRKAECRKGLYSAVFVCVTVKLGPGASRKDSITHFQMTNLALTLLNNACHTESSYEVCRACQQAVTVIKITGNLNRPIIRRVLPDENNDTKDVAELERETEKVSEENESIKKRLVQSELENQTQSRLIESLKQELESLKASFNKRERSLNVEEAAKTDKVTSDESSDDDDDDEHKDSHLADSEDLKEVMETKHSKLPRKDVKKDENAKGGRQKELDTSTRVRDQGQKAGNTTLGLSDHGESSHRKRAAAHSSDDVLGKKKKSKVDPSHVSINNASSSKMAEPVPSTSQSQANEDDDDSDNADNVEAMISDFVDMDPDIM